METKGEGLEFDTRTSLTKNQEKKYFMYFISRMQKRNIIEEIKNISKRPLEQGCPPKRERNDFPLN